jgi:hypothetical protein
VSDFCCVFDVSWDLLNPGAQQCLEVGVLPPLLGQVKGDWRSSRELRASIGAISMRSTCTAAALTSVLESPRRATPAVKRDLIVDWIDANSECSL